MIAMHQDALLFCPSLPSAFARDIGRRLHVETRKCLRDSEGDVGQTASGSKNESDSKRTISHYRISMAGWSTGYVVLSCGVHRNVNWSFLARAGVHEGPRGSGMPLQVSLARLARAGYRWVAGDACAAGGGGSSGPSRI